MRVHARVVWLAALVAACGGSDPKQQLETIDSAAAMTTLVGDALRQHHVSRRYARVTLRALRDEVQQLAASEQATAEVRARADSVRRAIDLALPAAEAQ